MLFSQQHTHSTKPHKINVQKIIYFKIKFGINLLQNYSKQRCGAGIKYHVRLRDQQNKMKSPETNPLTVKRFSARMSRPFKEERIVFSVSRAEKTGYPHVK